MPEAKKTKATVGLQTICGTCDWGFTIDHHEEWEAGPAFFNNNGRGRVEAGKRINVRSFCRHEAMPRDIEHLGAVEMPEPVLRCGLFEPEAEDA